MPISDGRTTISCAGMAAAAVRDCIGRAGLSMDRVVLQALAACLFAFVAIVHLRIRVPHASRIPAGHAGLALWSFLVSTAHGAGLMLVPALVPLCMGDAKAAAISTSGSVALALAAIGVHTAAMLAVTGLIASGVCRGWDAGVRYLACLKRA
ncbi:MAG: Membrane protein [uncultured Ramlibacter sp.]|uniref:Membrane protein n=1 Tax=uncultured Ramlibacter sp. TaxID=260755 RepID=A0A6J4NE82_9BURK|nr:MAG: Membrane protein [uncultured Ramlibacter sp.]